VLLAGWLWDDGSRRYPILQLLAEHRVRVNSGMGDGCSIVLQYGGPV
jgi:hypothetical protein